MHLDKVPQRKGTQKQLLTFSSMQILLFDFALAKSKAVTAYFTSKQLPFFTLVSPIMYAPSHTAPHVVNKQSEILTANKCIYAVILTG